jgi:hypothetical protein
MTGAYIETQTDTASANIIEPPRKINPGLLKCVATASGACLTAPIYAPGNTSYYAIDFKNDIYGILPSEHVAIVNPTYVDLLPSEVELTNLPSQFIYEY